MKIPILTIVVLFVSGCMTEKENYDFVFYKWNIRESYYLKFNSSDTLYYVNDYPLEEKTMYRILNPIEKKKIEKILDTITFPSQENFRSSVDDGIFYVFCFNRNMKSKKLSIKSRSGGPKQFWRFGNLLEDMKTKHTFHVLYRENILTETEKTFSISIPPVIK